MRSVFQLKWIVLLALTLVACRHNQVRYYSEPYFQQPMPFYPHQSPSFSHGGPQFGPSHGPNVPGPGLPQGIGNAQPLPVPRNVQEQMNQALAKAVRQLGAKSANGQMDPRICSLTDEYAQRMAARHGLLDHEDVDKRYKAISNGIGQRAAEIIANSYPSSGDSPDKGAYDCVQGWLSSPGHNAHMQPFHEKYCYSMAHSNDGRYYCIGLFAN